MFKPLGLFTARCPDSTCRRPTCFFAHGESSSSAITKPRSTVPTVPKIEATKRKNSVDVAGAQVKPVELGSSVNPGTRDARNVEAKEVKPSVVAEKVIKKAKVEMSGKGTPQSILPTSRPTGIITKPSPAATTPKPPPVAAASPVTSGKPISASIAINTSKPPVITMTSKISPQPFADRQKGLMTLYTQFQKLYAKILPSAPDIAHKSALIQEAEVSASSANVRAYKMAVHQAAVAVSRRQPPDSLSHPSVGTNKESRLAHEAVEKAKASRPTRSRIEGYCMALSDFREWAYPDPTDPSLTVGGGEEPDAEGTTQDCSRCKVSFTVSSQDLEDRIGECKFHYGRTAPERVEGRRKWIYSCCKRERGEAGCEDGVHVFNEKEDDEKLKKRVGYKSVKQIAESMNGPKGWVDVVAMDCEMIQTTAGSSLARATIVDEDGNILLDELVRQKVPILDLNSRFSGVNPGDLDKALMDLEAVREAACMFIGPDTIMVGHGLENDLRALRLVHDKVIDTAILFPHDKGKPYRRALRDIVKEKLGYFIQDRTSDLGHSSAEDAKATLECLKWKIRYDAE